MQISIKEKIYPIEMMKTPEELQNGMMGRKELNGAMCFKLKKGYHTFWMKDCLINLDLIFVVDNKIKKIFHNCQPCQSNDCEKYQGLAEYVLEFPGGSAKDFQINDEIKFINYLQ